MITMTDEATGQARAMGSGGLVWRSEHVAEGSGLTFYFDAEAGQSPSRDHIYVFKSRAMFELLDRVIGDPRPRRIIDLGIWQGGSAFALAALFDVERLVTLDICAPIASFDALRRSHPLGRRIAVYYETAQEDAARLGAMVDREFSAPPDLVIDDASHFYRESRASFEILFPRLQGGGWYVIEDWGWAHAPAVRWADQPSLAGLVFELQLAWLCHPELIGQVVVRREMVFIQKAPQAPVQRARLSLDALYERHHRSAPLVA